MMAPAKSSTTPPATALFAAAAAATGKTAASPTTSSCLNLLQLLLVRTLACLSPFPTIFSSSISLVLTGIVSILAAATTHYAFGRAITQRILAVAESTTTTKRSPARLYSSENLTALPDPVARYLKATLQDGQSLVRFVCIKQRGMYRTCASSDSWRRVHAEQYYSVTEPGFVWSATVELVPLVWLRGWESYVRGRGSLYWKLLSLFTVEDHRGDDVDRSMLLRYLSECPCFPTALLPSRRVTWEPIDAHSARCHMRDHGQHVSGVFEFDPATGHVVRFVARDTPRGPVGGKAVQGAAGAPCTWVRRYDQYRSIKGMQVPTQLESCWYDGQQEVPYARMTLVDVGCFDSVHGV